MVDFDGFISCTVFTPGCNFRCPFCHNALLVTGAAATINESDVFDYLVKRKGLVDAVCITGGEPTLHKDLPSFIKKVKNLSFLVKLDSNGTNPQMLKNLIDEKLVDYVAMDIKSDKQNYSLVAGVDNIRLDLIQESIDLLRSSNIGYEFRTTLVKEYHNEEMMKNISVWLAGSTNYYLQKFEDKGGNLIGGLSAIDKETANRFKDILSTTICNVNLRNYD